MTFRTSLLLAALLSLICIGYAPAQSVPHPESAQKVIFDTDIGDDIDDVFALGLLLQSPELNVLGVTSAWGDTELRARLLQRFLHETGHSTIPIGIGRRTPPSPGAGAFTQAAWARRMPSPSSTLPSAVDFILDQIRRYPGQITLISVAPFSNIGDLLDRDPAAFHQLKRVIIMGGSVRKGYGDLGYKPDHGPDPEYNIAMDIPAAKKLFTSGIPLTVLPLDSTQLKLDEVKRSALFSADTPLTNATSSLYQQWAYATSNPTPTLFDVLAVAQAIDPATCPTEPMLLTVDDQGYTREGRTTGQIRPNVLVCLRPNAERVFGLLIKRLIAQGDTDANPPRRHTD